MAGGEQVKRVLVMGVGNTLMQDDGVGIHVIEALAADPERHPALEVIDGGTIGLALLPEIEDADAVIVVDASELKAEPGTIAVFRGREIDEQLSGKKRTVHEVALLDLFSAASIRGRLPRQRALVAIQPACTEWGIESTPPVRAAVALACETINGLARDWCAAEAAA